MMKRPVFYGAALAITLLGGLLGACASPGDYRKVDSYVEREFFSKALDAIEDAQDTEKESKRLYPDKNKILLELDRGMIAHFAGDYHISEEHLEDGERLMEDAFTKSVSLEVASYIANDTVREYAGEDYEDCYLNLFNALNYYHQGNLEDAAVEIRKVNQKLQWLPGKYEGQSSRVKDYARSLMNRFTFPNQEITSFTDSVFARYLGMLFYRGLGNDDDARIEGDFMRQTHRAFPQVYRNPLPRSADTELEPIPPGKARLNLLSFAGLSPLKVEIKETYLGMNFYLPALKDIRLTEVRRVELSIDKGPTVSLDLLENIGAVMMETYKSKYGLTYLKTLIRAGLKQIGAAGASAAAQGANIVKSEEGAASAAFLSGMASSAIDATEAADTRMARYLPHYVYAGGINLEPGTYSFTVTYYNGKDEAVYRDRRKDVEVRAGALNLAESAYLETAEYIPPPDRKAEQKQQRENLLVAFMSKVSKRVTINHTSALTGVAVFNIGSGLGQFGGLGIGAYAGWGYLGIGLGAALAGICGADFVGAYGLGGWVYGPIGAGALGTVIGTAVGTSIAGSASAYSGSFGLGYEIGTLYIDANAGFTLANSGPFYWDPFFALNFDVGAGFKFYFSRQKLWLGYWSLGYRFRLPGLVYAPEPGVHLVHAVETRIGFGGWFIGYQYEFKGFNDDYYAMIPRWEDSLIHGVHSITTGFSIPIVLKE